MIFAIVFSWRLFFYAVIVTHTHYMVITSLLACSQELTFLLQSVIYNKTTTTVLGVFFLCRSCLYYKLCTNEVIDLIPRIRSDHTHL